MFLKPYLPLIAFTLITTSFSLRVATQEREELLPNNLHIIYTELDKTPMSETQLEEIAQDIDHRLQSLFANFKEQSPQQNISDLHALRKHLNTTYRFNKRVQYRLANTPLNSVILLLSNLLSALPSARSFDPENCEFYMNRLIIRAQVSVNSDKLHKWVDQILDLLPHLCLRED